MQREQALHTGQRFYCLCQWYYYWEKKKKSPLLRAEGSGSGHSILFRSVVPEDLFCARQGLGHGRHWLWGLVSRSLLGRVHSPGALGAPKQGQLMRGHVSVEEGEALQDALHQALCRGML